VPPTHDSKKKKKGNPVDQEKILTKANKLCFQSMPQDRLWRELRRNYRARGPVGDLLPSLHVIHGCQSFHGSRPSVFNLIHKSSFIPYQGSSFLLIGQAIRHIALVLVTISVRRNRRLRILFPAGRHFRMSAI